MFSTPLSSFSSKPSSPFLSSSSSLNSSDFRTSLKLLASDPQRCIPPLSSHSSLPFPSSSSPTQTPAPAARPVATFSPPLDSQTLHPRALYRYFRADDPDCQMCACDDNGKVRCPVPKDQTHTVPDKCYFGKKYCIKIGDPTNEMETKDATKGTADKGKPKKGTVAGGGVIGGRIGKSTKTRPQPPKAQKAVGDVDVDGNAKVMDWLGSQ